MKTAPFFIVILLLFSCKIEKDFMRKLPPEKRTPYPVKLSNYSRADNLNYVGIPASTTDRSILTFSDEGAWFSYGFSDSDSMQGGFTGPFLMTQENGVWASKMLAQLNINKILEKNNLPSDKFEVEQHSFPSHLEQVYTNQYLTITQHLFFKSNLEAIVNTTIQNHSGQTLKISPIWSGTLMNESLSILNLAGGVQISSTKSEAMQFIQTNADSTTISADGRSYSIVLNEIELNTRIFTEFSIGQFVFFRDQGDQVLHFRSGRFPKDSISLIQRKLNQKNKELLDLFGQHSNEYKNGIFYDLTTKAYLTLQNNWRAPAGELKHAGLFPSYNYKWSHGFWAWDSWKHAVALAKFNPDLAQDQIRAMYDFQEKNGFIPDCVYRDTTIEKHNYRNTKAPLSAWAVWNSQDGNSDREFLAEMYPQLVNQHNWWYENRDHDRDGLCEYGSTDGTLIAAKWESRV
ncbi:MAG: hypothetical protein HRT57_17770 [Crocinitomicaceae bacterium]|nr:hypothetical protein [Crocinitomicaceae bacterium]